MRVLWICGIPLTSICEQLNIEKYNTGSWINAIAKQIEQDRDIELVYAFQQSIKKEIIKGKSGNIQYYGFPQSEDASMYLKLIFKETKPDFIHIFGTENKFALDAVKTYNCLEKTVINIQGLTYAIERHYVDGLPQKVVSRYTLRDLIRKNNIQSEKKRFDKCSLFEQELIKSSKYIIGRTDFDQAITRQMNPTEKYYFCPEILRDSFYQEENVWNLENCQKHTLLISQAHYPVKGLHFVIEAMVILKNKYPDILLKVAGNDIRIIPRNRRQLLIQSSYAKYLFSLIKKYDLENNIIFLGSLNEGEMCNEFKHTHIFVSASTIENESNSLSEAMILGVPSVASFVGGVTSRIEHKKDGFLYPHNEPYMLAYYVEQIFENAEIANNFSKLSREKSLKLFDKSTNYNILKKIYGEIMRDAK